MNRTTEIEPRVGTHPPLPAAPSAPVDQGRKSLRQLNPEATDFLLDATRILADSLDLDATLGCVARLSIPHLGCWCIVDLCDGEDLRRVAIIHSNPAHQWAADQLLSGWPPQRDDPLGVPSAVRTRRSEIVYPVNDEMLVLAAQSVENLEMLRVLEIGSLMTVPLLARGAVLGAITYVAPKDGDGFSELEVALAEDLAARCAMAIDNARLFQQAREAQARAEDANLAKMRFLSTMSHEIRTPLNAISGYVELLETGIRGALTEKQLVDLRRIRVNQRHLLGLVEAVLSYARVDAGKIEFAPADVPLASLLADTEMLVAPLAEQKGISIDGCWHPRAETDLTVYADRDKLQQVLVNLLANAIKFSPAGGTVAVVCEPADGRVEIRVTDHGVGIGPEHLDRIFEPFVQVDDGLKKRHGGIGLGLAISRELAVGMGGGLFAESELGRGSTFTLVLACGRG